MATWLLLVWTVLVFVHACMTTSPLKERLNFKSATVGEDINLTCAVENQTGLVWYKQSLFLKPSNSFFKKHCKERKSDGQFENCPHFAFSNTSNDVTLSISNVQLINSGIYHCLSFADRQISFWESITVIVRESNLTVAEASKNGSSESWKCVTDTGSFGEENRVGWFWFGKHIDNGDFYCHGSGNSRVGIYQYSVTPPCNPPEKVGHDYVVYILSGALVFSMFLVLGLAFSLYHVTKKHKSSGAELDRAGASKSGPNGEDQDEDNLHYAAVRLNPVSKQRKPVSADCVYSTVQLR